MPENHRTRGHGDAATRGKNWRGRGGEWGRGRKTLIIYKVLPCVSCGKLNIDFIATANFPSSRNFSASSVSSVVKNIAFIEIGIASARSSASQ